MPSPTRLSLVPRTEIWIAVGLFLAGAVLVARALFASPFAAESSPDLRLSTPAAMPSPSEAPRDVPAPAIGFRLTVVELAPVRA